MPVRFTCQHCSSTLSASAGKAGLEVTCPHCRRKTAVPASKDQDADAPAPPKPAVPQARSEPVATALPISSRTVLFHPEIAPAAASERDEITWVVEKEPPQIKVAPRDSLIDYDKIALPRYVLYGQGILLAAVGMIALVLGILIGRASAPRVVENAGAPKPCYLTGTVSYANRSGTVVPDAGAVVIVVPQDTRPPEKAPIDGLRPADPLPLPDHPSVSRLRGIGGDYARADEQGQFKLRVPNTGAYFLLVVSHAAQRSAKDKLETAHLAQIGRYVMPATELIENRRYQWLAEQIKRDREFRIVLE